MMNSIVKVVMITCSVFCISSCAALNPLDLLMPDKGIEATAQIGKENLQENNTVKVEETVDNSTTQQADVISNKDETSYADSTVNTITQNVPPEFLILLVFMSGWAIPNPRECWKGLKVMLFDLYSGVTYPVRELGGFIKSLLSGDGEDK